MVYSFLSSSSSQRRSDVLYDNYDLGRKLGRGGSAKVYEVKCKDSRRSYACKVLSKKKYKQEKIYREIRMLSKLSHDNIVKFRDYYENRNDIFIIMQLAEGGELFHALRKNGRFEETSAKNIIHPLLDAISYLHQQNIVHRDIKLENVLLQKPVEKARNGRRTQVDKSDVLLVDFGLAKQLNNEGQRTFSLCGSQYYVAPEVWLGCGYGLQVDLWGVGVVMYMLLTDTPPFYQTEEMDLVQSIVTGRYDLNSELFKHTSLEAKDLLGKLLTLNPARRVSAVQALSHSWFRE